MSKPSMSGKIGVIIPFFQREKGILRKTVDSVLAQEGADDLEVIVVDDSSPISAESELCGLSDAARGSIKIVRQENRGPGGARNTGLDNLSDDTEFIAFVDSDDIWEKDHLERAVGALERGYDFYTSDSWEENVASHLQELRHGLLQELVPIDDDGSLFVHKGSPFEHLVLNNFVCPSSVVLRRDGFSDLRFDESLSTGEDRLFWLDAFSRTDRVVFATTRDVFMGKGVNIYRSITEGSEASLISILDQISLRKNIMRRFQIRDRLEHALFSQIADLRKSFAYNLVRMAAKGKVPSRAVFARLRAVDPRLAPQLPYFALRLVLTRLTRDPSYSKRD